MYSVGVIRVYPLIFLPKLKIGENFKYGLVKYPLMFKTEKIEKIVELTLLTGFIKNDIPTSLMLIADAEHAKTSILRGFKCYKTIETADISPKVITTTLVPLLRTYSVNHLIIPDMVKVLSHKTATVNATVAFFNALMEEGILRSMFFGQVFDFEVPRVCGIITSVTKDFFKYVCKKWHQIGFTSRFLPVSYKYSKETRTEIHKLIRQNIFYKEIKELAAEDKVLYDRRFNISIPNDIASSLSVRAQRIADEQCEYSFYIPVQGGKQMKINLNILGFRLHRQLRQLVRAEALRRTIDDPVVTWPDLEEIFSLLDYIRFPGEPKVI